MATYKYADWTIGRVEALLNILGEENAKALLRGQIKPSFELVNLTLDCSKPFDTIQFLGKDWKVDGQDERANQLTQVDFAQAQYETCLEEGESYITGEEKLRRLKEAGHVRLGGSHFLALWEDYRFRGADSELEKLRQRGITTLDFMGLILRDPAGNRYALYLRWAGGKWRWLCRWLEDDWRGRFFSVVLPARLPSESVP